MTQQTAWYLRQDPATRDDSVTIIEGLTLRSTGFINSRISSRRTETWGNEDGAEDIDFATIDRRAIKDALGRSQFIVGHVSAHVKAAVPFV
jgi:hypothetical protein